MLSSTKLKSLKPFIDIIESHKGKTLGDIFLELNSHRHQHFKKGASGLIIENLLGLENNNSKKADLENACETIVDLIHDFFPVIITESQES